MSNRGYARGPFGQVHFQDTGSGVPLLLCHQSPSSLRQYDPVYPLLAAAGIRAIGVDTPGFGQSDVPDKVPTIEDYADSVTSVLDELGIGRAHILGQHTGSMVAMEATIRHPSRYGRLIMNSPTPFTAEQRAEWLGTLIPRQRNWQLRRDGSHLQDMWDRRLRSTGPNWTDLNAMHRHVVQMLNAGETLWYGHHASLVYDQLGRLARVKHPCLVLTNTGDAVYEVVRRTMEARPDFDYVELPGGTHDIVDEQPEAWAAAVAHYLTAAGSTYPA